MANSRGKRALGKRGKTWETYEEVAQYVLGQMSKRFGLAEVQGKQKLKGLSGTDWEIDAKGIRETDGAIIVVECRRYKRSLNQEALAAVAYRIRDTGAAGGITVSPMPLQKGAAKVSAASNIKHVQLMPDSTRKQWAAQIGTAMHYGVTLQAEVKAAASVHAQLIRGGQVVEERTA